MICTNLYSKDPFFFIVFALFVKDLVVGGRLCIIVKFLFPFSCPIILHERTRAKTFQARSMWWFSFTVIGHRPRTVGNFAQNLPVLPRKTWKSFVNHRLAKNRVDLVWKSALWLGDIELLIVSQWFALQKVVGLWQEGHWVWRPHRGETKISLYFLVWKQSFRAYLSYINKQTNVRYKEVRIPRCGYSENLWTSSLRWAHYEVSLHLFQRASCFCWSVFLFEDPDSYE